MKECHICLRKVENSKIKRYRYKDRLVKACFECVQIEENHRKEKHIVHLEQLHNRGVKDEDILRAIGELSFVLKAPKKSDLAEKFNGVLKKFVADNQLVLKS